MSTATLYLGDVFDVMAGMPDDSVDLVLTSPPFLALRSYLPADHADKAKEIGSESSPAEFLDTLLRLTAEWGRLIGPRGSICVELGDTYSGSGGAGGDYAPDGLRDGQGKFDGSNHRRGKIVDFDSGRRNPGPGWPMDKSLCGIPHLYHLSLAYGRNLLTGEQSPAGMWRVRNVVAWCRPNPAVGALGDKFRPATSYMTIATKARDRWFDLDAVRTPLTAPERTQKNGGARRAESRHGERETNDVIVQNQNGAPPLDHWWFDDEFDQDAWLVSTEAYPGSHYATWPRKLLDRPIQAMCPREVCRECGEPRRRITSDPVYVGTDSGVPIEPESWASFAGDARRKKSGGAHMSKNDGRIETATRTVETVGWTECDCGVDYRLGVVLDPFAGSGTTLAVATGHGRTAIGIDIDERNEHLIRERVGMLLTDVIDTRCVSVGSPDVVDVIPSGGEV